MSNNTHTWLRIAAVGLIAALQYFPHRHHDAAKMRAAAPIVHDATHDTTLATTAPQAAQASAELATAR